MRSNIPMKRSMQPPKKKAPPVSSNITTERKKANSNSNKYAIITASSLNEQRKLYDDVSNLKKTYESEIEQISMENQSIKEIFINFLAKWIQNLETKINITNSSLNEATQVLNSQISDFESKFNNLYEGYIFLQNENQNLKVQILNEKNQFQDKSNEFDRLKLQFESFRIQSQNENQEILSQHQNNKQFENENKALRDQISQLNFEYQKIQEQYQILNNSYRTLQKDLEEKTNLIGDLSSQITNNENLATIAEMSQQNLINENKVLKEKLEMANQLAELHRNSPELQRKSEEVENLRESINLKDLEIEQLKSRINELSNIGSHGQFEVYEEQISLKDQEIASLNQKIGELSSKLNQGDSLQDFVDSLSKIAEDSEQSKAMRQQLDQKDEIIKEMNTQIQLKDREIRSLENASKDIIEKENLISNLQQSIFDMNVDIKLKNSSIEEFKSILKEKELTISNLTFRLDEKDQMIENLESQASSINKEKENNEIENGEMKDKINSLTKKLQSMQIKIDNLESSSSNEKANYEEEIAKLKDRCQLLDLQNEEKQSLIIEKDDQIEELTSRQSLYIQKMQEGDQLARDNDLLKTKFDEQKKQFETIQSRKEELENEMKIMSDEKNKIKLELSQIEYDKNKLLEKVEEFESKFDKDLEEENKQLAQYVKELEAQVIDLNMKSQKATIFESQIKNYDEEMSHLKLMLDTYKEMNEVLQNKLDQSNNELFSKLSNENTSQISKMSASPPQKCTIACSPFKVGDSSVRFDDDSSDPKQQEIIIENENLKKEIDKWRKTTVLLKNNIQIIENDKNFYQAECGRLNSILTTNRQDQEVNIKAINDKEKEISKLKANRDNLRKQVQQIIDEKNEMNDIIKKVSSELTCAKRSYNELSLQYKNFTGQLSNVLHKESEKEIIYAVIHLINSFRGLMVKDLSDIASKIQCFTVSHLSMIQLHADKFNQKLELTLSSLSRLDKKINLASRKINQIKESKISDNISGIRAIPATERKRPLLSLLNRNLIPNPGKPQYVKRDNPSNFSDVNPNINDLLFS